MSDDPSKRASPDRDRINVREKHELDYWTRELGVDVETLKATVNRVGPFVEKVRRELQSLKPEA